MLDCCDLNLGMEEFLGKGEAAFAGLGVTTPVILFLSAFAAGTGAGRTTDPKL